MTYKIESGIEIPIARAGFKSRYPFEQMEIGQSFFVPKDYGKKEKASLKDRLNGSRIGAQRRFKPKRFALRTMTNPDGYRIWRIEDAKPGKVTGKAIGKKATMVLTDDISANEIVTAPQVDAAKTLISDAPSSDIDDFGVPWHPEHHSAKQGINNDGSWRLRSTKWLPDAEKVKAKANAEAYVAFWRKTSNVPVVKDPLTVDKLLKALRYDPETGALIWRERSGPKMKSWNTRFAGKKVRGNLISPKHRTLAMNLLGHQVKMRSVIWCMMTGEWSDDIRHANGDKEDFRWANLTK